MFSVEEERERYFQIYSDSWGVMNGGRVGGGERKTRKKPEEEGEERIGDEEEDREL